MRCYSIEGVVSFIIMWFVVNFDFLRFVDKVIYRKLIWVVWEIWIEIVWNFIFKNNSKKEKWEIGGGVYGVYKR